jgi:hypothetical protein
MPNVRFIHLLFLCLCAVAAPARAAEQERFVIEAENDSLEFDLTTGTITYTNGVTVKYGDARLSARKARLNQDSGDVLAEGDVRLQQQNEVWYGDRIEYNFKSRKILAVNFKAGQPPFFVRPSRAIRPMRCTCWRTPSSRPTITRSPATEFARALSALRPAITLRQRMPSFT